MQVFKIPLKERIKRIDPILFAATAFLSLVSIITILSAIDNFGRSKLYMQIAMTAVGLIAAFVIANLDYRFFVDRFHIVFFVGSALLLAITLLFAVVIFSPVLPNSSVIASSNAEPTKNTI